MMNYKKSKAVKIPSENLIVDPSNLVLIYVSMGIIRSRFKSWA
jgi:hypothetical protein